MVVLANQSSSIDFRWESDMIAPILHARSKIAGKGVRASIDARLEVPTASGVPDVLLVEWNEEAIERREASALEPLLDLTKIRVVTKLGDGPLTTGELSAHVGVGASHLRRSVVPDLLARGWIGTTDSGLVCLQDGILYESLAHGLVTIEAKLRDWQRAFQQAARHRASADMSFIALDAARSAPGLAHAAELAFEGVGLITVDATSGDVRVMSRPRRPRRSRRRPDEYNFLAEHAWRLRSRNQVSGQSYTVFGRELPRPLVADLLQHGVPQR